MKFVLTIIAFSSLFAQNVFANTKNPNQTNDSENNSALIDEIVVEGIDENMLNDILFKYNPNANDLEKQFQTVFADLITTQNKYNQQMTSLMKKEGFKDMMINRSMPIVKEIFKFVWNKFVLILDSIWSAVNQIFEKFFNHSLPITYYKSVKQLGQQFGSYVCQEAIGRIFNMNEEKAVHHCSTAFSSLSI